MTGLLIAIRNFTIALMLAWMGFSAAPSGDDDNGSESAGSPAAALSLFGG
ncbi:MAG: hypothetical protein ABJH52_03650 [Henriciella sp.]